MKECNVLEPKPELVKEEPSTSKKIVDKVLLNIAKERCRKLAEDNATEYLKKKGKGLSSSCTMRYLSAYKGVENKEEFYDQLKDYITVNFTGTNNIDILNFVRNSFESFDDAVDGNNEFINNGKMLEVVAANKNEVFKTYIQSYIFAAKMYYREV